MSQITNEMIFKHGFHDYLGRFPSEGKDFFYAEMVDDPQNPRAEQDWRDLGISRAKGMETKSIPIIDGKDQMVSVKEGAK